MEDDRTARFALPMLHAAQAQKEVTHNEALALIDAALHACVEANGQDAPPADPSPGACSIVGNAPTGAWSGQAHALACWTDGGWRFVGPRPGMTVRHAGTGRTLAWDGTAWRDGVLDVARVRVAGVAVLGAQQPAIADVAGGSIVDGEARAAIAAMLAALRQHGLIGG